MEALIVGGGIGGLGTAVALHRQGVTVRVYERAAGPARGGAALSLWPNALRGLDTLELGDAVRDHAALGGDSGIRRPDGKWFGYTRLGEAIRTTYGDPLVVIARQFLTDLLLAALPPGTVRYDQRVTEVSTGSLSGPAVVLTADGNAEADLVVVADGARSALRSWLLPAAPPLQYAGYTAWRMLVPTPATLESFETWGSNGRRFAVLPLADGSCYCYATVTAPADTRPDSEITELRRLFGNWHQPIPDILDAAANGVVLRNDISELGPLPAYHVNRVALLGDAAHAMTPELGQGACLAIEDAVVLAATVNPERPEDVTADLKHYTEARLPRTTVVSRRSHQAGKLHQQPLPIQYLAARLMGRLPAKAIARGLRPIVDWQPPGGIRRGPAA
ncbi:MAG: monooxygenase [Micrococcaceae bacterium]|nr:monooxygenase [Micrococcaceae bacterium]